MSANKSMPVVVVAVIVASSTFAAGDAARVAGDLKVDGIHFSVDGSVVRKLSDLSSVWALLGSDIYYLGGNVGIGTATPMQRLSVAGTIESTEGGFRFPDGTIQTTAGGATLGPNTFTGTQTILTGGAANMGLIVKGAAGQTANLQEWQTSAGSAVASVNPAGDLTLAGNLNLPVTSATTGIIKSGGQNLIHSYGSQNFFAGLGAGNTTLTQGWNTGVGRSVLGLNTTGGFNSALGTLALMNNSSGTGNCAMGYSAMYDNTSGNANVAVGNGSMGDNIGGGYNTAVGNASLSYNTYGSYNTALGTHAGRTATVANANTTGTNNTFIGAYSGPGTPTQLTNATAIGYNALVSQSNSLVLGGTGTDAVKVGVGTKTPTEALDVVGNVRINNKDLYLRTDIDTNHGLGWFGAGKLFAAASIDGPVLYGFSGGVLGTTSSGQNIALAWNSSGNVGIGTATPSERLDVAGTVKAASFSGSGASLTGLNAGSISTGTLAIAQGGTGAASASAAISNLGAAPSTHYHDSLYQRKYARTGVVAKDGGDFTSPLQAMDALSEWCGTPSTNNPCLLKIMPGVYSIGTNNIVMRPYVDIEGSGEGMTKIIGTINSDTAGVVRGASNAELRNLTVENAGVGNDVSFALYNQNVSPKISHVTLKASANFSAEAIHNEGSSLTLSDVTVTTSSNIVCKGIYNWNSTTIMTNVTITTGSACSGDGIYNDSGSIGGASLIANNLAIVVSNLVGPCHGIYNDGGKIELLNSSVSAANRPDSYDAIYNRAGNIVRVVSSKLDGYVNDLRSDIIYEGVRIPPNVIYSDGIYRLFGSSTVQVGAASGSGLVIESHDMESNLQEWKGPGNYLLASMSPWGVLNLPTDGLSVGWDGNSIYGQFVLAAGKVGIGKSAPTEALDVLGNIRINDRDVLFRKDTDAFHGVGFYGGTKTFADTDVNGPVLYGNGGGALGSINGAQRIALSWNSSNNISMSGSLTTQGDITTQSNLNVNSIPTGTTSYVLCSSLANRGTVQRCSASSRKLKENITGLTLGLDTVNKLRPVSFTWKNNGNGDVGFIAEEVAELNPVLAIYNEQGEPDGVKYANMSAVLVKAVQEQQQEIERQKTKIESQGAMLEVLKAELAALKAVMSR